MQYLFNKGSYIVEYGVDKINLVKTSSRINLEYNFSLSLP